jgi:hypothetical protein
MHLEVRKTSPLVVEDHSWLGDAADTQSWRPATLVVASFTKNTHYPQGVLRSGTVIGKYTSGPNQGLWGAYDNAATDGRQTAVGFLATTQQIEVAGGIPVRIGVPLKERGFIKPYNLPAGHGLDAAARADLAAHFIFRD